MGYADPQYSLDPRYKGVGLQPQDIPYLPQDYSATYGFLPEPGPNSGQMQIGQDPQNLFQKTRSRVQSWADEHPFLSMLLLQNPALGATLYGLGRGASWVGNKLAPYAVPTNPYGTMANLEEWSGGTDPFGYVGATQGPADGIAAGIEERFMGQRESNLPGNPDLPRSWQQGGGQPGGGMGFGGGMTSYLMPVAGGMPPIPVIEGPKYTGAPYNPMAFSNYMETGDTSWWDQYLPGAPGGPPGGPPGGGLRQRDPNQPRIRGQRGEGFGARGDGAMNPIEWSGGYGADTAGGGIGYEVDWNY